MSSHIMREIMRAQCADRNFDLFRATESLECSVVHRNSLPPESFQGRNCVPPQSLQGRNRVPPESFQGRNCVPPQSLQGEHQEAVPSCAMLFHECDIMHAPYAAILLCAPRLRAMGESSTDYARHYARQYFPYFLLCAECLVQKK